MTTIRPHTRHSSKALEPMVLVFPECLPQVRAKAKAKVRVRVRDAEAKVKGKVKVTVKAKVKERAKVKVKAKEKAKVKVRVNMSVQVQLQVMVVSSVGPRNTGPKIVLRPAGGRIALRRDGLNSVGMNRP